jgi:hypothetical protein
MHWFSLSQNKPIFFQLHSLHTKQKCSCAPNNKDDIDTIYLKCLGDLVSFICGFKSVYCIHRSVQ